MKFTDVIQSADWKAEKHVPVISAPETVKAGEKFNVEVCVGKEIAHPNTTEHHIRWIKLYFKPDNGKFAYELGTYQFDAHGESAEGPNKGPVYSEPAVNAFIKLSASGTLLAAAYCNIHGLWESSKTITVQA
ncbi:desulfoferrodoxin [Lucifera butyrica]|uniref:Desulfoferrodoxin n=1 Tax=Lucifera butyrica TaxID=1351585 RepID=A0A498RB39_9FIRM|nr:class II SORL domain-containing protein [Lucifera butyrica]VBB08694.1 desulfoferrodoxin [Lucifera butyrica]